MRTVVKLGLGIFLGGVLLVGACTALLAGGTDLEETGGEGATDAGDRYCSPEKEDRIAALEIGNGETINDPDRLRRATKRFLREVDDAPDSAWCVDQEIEFLVTVWNGSRGERGWGDAARQVGRLRKFERR